MDETPLPYRDHFSSHVSWSIPNILPEGINLFNVLDPVSNPLSLLDAFFLYNMLIIRSVVHLSDSWVLTRCYCS